jgi:hypothetical protein
MTLGDLGGMSFGMFNNRFALQRGDYHFTLPIGGKRIGYAYIRKNGCTAFKRAVGIGSGAPIGELVVQFKWRPWLRHDATIFVWRDPVERLVSLYRNKFLDHQDNGAILQAYRAAMAEDHPSDFERFVEFAIMGADPHCLPQRKHLKPIRYTHAIELPRLYEEMVTIVGTKSAEPFRSRVNASSKIEVPVSERARRMIEGYYDCDYRMIDTIKVNKT